MLPFFSLIIPVYNVERYIRRCLQSCVNQTFKNIEILIIDDCGNDTSMEIAEEFAKRDSRIRIIHHPHNRGTFQARLSGIEQVRGKYILFIDSDDRIHLKTCEVLHHTLSQDPKDCAVFNIANCHWDPPLKRLPKNPQRKHLKLIKKIYKSSICAKAYSRQSIASAILAIKQYFPNLPRLVMCEDALMCFCILYFVRDFTFIPKTLYFYSNNPQSITRKPTLDTLYTRKNNVAFIACLFENFQHFPPVQSQIQGFIRYKNKIIRELLKHCKDLQYNILEIRTIHRLSKMKNPMQKLMIYNLRHTPSRRLIPKTIFKTLLMLLRGSKSR